jgi:hypothetical protein
MTADELKLSLLAGVNMVLAGVNMVLAGVNMEEL